MPTTEVNGVDTFYKRYGSNHPIVFLHGSGWDHRQWAPQFENLSDDYEVIAYDYRGHGRTAGSDADELTADMLADDLRSFVECLDIERPTVVGCSLGGRIAYTFAARHPDALSALVTLEASPVDPDNRPLVGSLVRRGLLKMAPVVGFERLSRFLVWAESLTSGEDETIVDGLGVSQREYVLEAISMVDERELLKFTSAHSKKIDVSQITVPSLVLTGDNPDKRFVRAAETLVSEVPAARQETVPSGGHGANMDNPEAFNQLLRGFLAGTTVG